MSYLVDLKTPKSYEFVVEKIDWGTIQTEGNFYGTYDYLLSVDVLQDGAKNSVVDKMLIKGVERTKDLDFRGQFPKMTPDAPFRLQLILLSDGKPYQQATQETRLNLLRYGIDVDLSNGEMQAKIKIKVKGLKEEPPLDEYDSLVFGP